MHSCQTITDEHYKITSINEETSVKEKHAKVNRYFFCRTFIRVAPKICHPNALLLYPFCHPFPIRPPHAGSEDSHLQYGARGSEEWQRSGACGIKFRIGKGLNHTWDTDHPHPVIGTATPFLLEDFLVYFRRKDTLHSSPGFFQRWIGKGAGDWNQDGKTILIGVDPWPTCKYSRSREQ